MKKRKKMQFSSRKKVKRVYLKRKNPSPFEKKMVLSREVDLERKRRITEKIRDKLKIIANTASETSDLSSEKFKLFDNYINELIYKLSILLSGSNQAYRLEELMTKYGQESSDEPFGGIF